MGQVNMHKKRNVNLYNMPQHEQDMPYEKQDMPVFPAYLVFVLSSLKQGESQQN